MKLFEQPTRNLFFTGKGGVGKTLMACAAAIQLADRGMRVLLISTDPASNLDQMLGTTLSTEPTPVESVPNLLALNIDPEVAAREYRERIVEPYRGRLPDAALRSMEEQYAGSCTLEIASFDEFSRLLGDAQATLDFDHVVFDTAPTGHTLRLLTLPSAWSGFIETNTTGTSCLGPLAGLQDQRLLYQRTVEALSDSQRTTLVLVTRPEPTALREVARTSVELKKLGVDNQQLIINGVFSGDTADDPVAAALRERGQAAMAAIPVEISQLDRTAVPLVGFRLVGVEAIRQFSGGDDSSDNAPRIQPLNHSLPEGLAPLIDDLETNGRGVILTMGKGGVGKTTIASAIAVALAERGHAVHLSTTDPAAHLSATLAAAEIPGLTVGRIDPVKETADYTEEVMQSAGSGLDADGRSLLLEDLRSPCTEEVAVFRAFAKAVSQGTDRFVVLDTAPTGHTILLLDAALAYHREVTRQSSQIPDSVENLLPRLRDPDFTRVLIVTLPEATPVQEAALLQRDLLRAEITPFAWVINQSLLPLRVTDPILMQRRQHELPFVDEVETSHASRVALVPWQDESPTGAEGMRRVAGLVVRESPLA